MYELKTRNRNVEKKLKDYLMIRRDIFEKLNRLKINPSEFTEGKLFYQLSNC